MSRSISTAIVLTICISAWAEMQLDISTFLTQVEQKNQGYIAGEELEKSYWAQSVESSLLLAPKFFTSASVGFQNDPQFIPNFPLFLKNAKLINEVYKIGVEQETPIGLDWQISTTSSLFQLKVNNSVSLPLGVTLPVPGVDSSITFPVTIDANLPISAPSWSTVQGLSLTQHLWRNCFGQKRRAQIDQSKYAVRAQAFKEQFKLQNSRAQAENTYWQLVIARALKEIRKETLDQSEKLVALVKEKKEEGLSLESEYYQALSILNGSQFDYRKSEDAETAISLSFNSLRSISSPTVPESLISLNQDLIEQLTPKQRGERSDLKAEEELFKSQEAQNIVSINNLLPELDVSAVVGWQGNSTNFGASFNHSFNQPALSALVLVKLNIPISPFKISNVKQAYRSNTYSAKLHLERMKFEHNQEWDQLQTRLKENKELLEFLIKNAEVQKAKFENTQIEYDRGLTTFFSLTSAQNDYQNSKIAILQTFQVILDILLNLGLYESD